MGQAAIYYELSQRAAQAIMLTVAYGGALTYTAVQASDLIEVWTDENPIRDRLLKGDGQSYETVKNIALICNLITPAIGSWAEGLGYSTHKEIRELTKKLTTKKDTAFFWSGRTQGVGGSDVAEQIARERGGTTLEAVISNNLIDMPEWNFNDSDAMQAWEDASRIYAQQASGVVRAVIGENVRPDSVWNTIELPTLLANEKVTKIIVIDPATLQETIIFGR